MKRLTTAQTIALLRAISSFMEEHPDRVDSQLLVANEKLHENMRRECHANDREITVDLQRVAVGE